MIQINSKAELNRAVANALHPEPPLSERRAIHESGYWRWVPPSQCDCMDCWAGQAKAQSQAAHHIPGHWEPADFATGPVASKLLRDRMVQRGCEWVISVAPRDRYHATIAITSGHHLHGQHHQEETAFALAALRALGVEFELVDGWEGR